MFCEHKAIKWKKVSAKKARQTYVIEERSQGLIDPEENFPEEPSHYFVATGDIVIDGPIGFGAEDDDDATVYVIDGNLTVRGPLSATQGDFYGVLLVTGSVTCEDFESMWDGQVVIGGGLTVSRLMVTNLGDAGVLVVRGPVSAGTWLEISGRGSIDLSGPAKGRMLRGPGEEFPEGSTGLDEDGNPLDPDEDDAPHHMFDASTASDASTALLPEFIEDGEIDADALRDAIREGRPVLR